MKVWALLYSYFPTGASWSSLNGMRAIKDSISHQIIVIQSEENEVLLQVCTVGSVLCLLMISFRERLS